MAFIWTSITSYKLLLLFTLFSSGLHHFSAASIEFEVGESKGWAVPPSDDIGFYNKWASEKRFQVGDTAVFKYMKDSVMVVTEDGYDQCNSSYPAFFANSGNTVYELDRPGPFYFISGVTGHCEKGQKMIIKVLGAETSPPSRGSQDDINPPPGSEETSAALPRAGIPYILIPSQLVLLLLGFLYH